MMACAAEHIVCAICDGGGKIWYPSDLPACAGCYRKCWLCSGKGYTDVSEIDWDAFFANATAELITED